MTPPRRSPRRRRRDGSAPPAPLRALRADLACAEASELLRATGIEELPVVERGAGLGTVRLAELELAVHHGVGRLPLRDVAIARAPGRSAVGRRAPLERLPATWVGVLRQLGETATSLGSPAYLVGGVVRDLLGGHASDDLDVVVDGDPLPLVRALGRRARTHPAFATATVELEGGVRLDLARARAERYARPAALPQVEPAGIGPDLRRRDFTIHAMAAALGPGEWGRLIDPCGGVGDLERELVRVLHGLSFIEDPTRAFRAAELVARRRFAIEPRTEHALRVALREGVFAHLSSTRLWRELRRCLRGRRKAAVVAELGRLGLLHVLHPRLRPGRALATRFARAERTLRWCTERAVLDRDGAALVAVALLALGLARSDRRELAARLAPPAAARALLSEGPERARVVLERLRGRPGPARIYEACHGERPELLALAMAATRSATARRAIAVYLRRLRSVRADISGHDLQAAGVRPGPDVARGLGAALRAKLAGRAPSAARQLAYALRALHRA